MRRWIVIILSLWMLGANAGMLTPSSARAMLDALPLHDIEGIWQLTDDGASVVIVRSNATASAGEVTGYDMIVLESPDRALLPGTKIGELTPLAQPLTYDGRILIIGDGKIKPAKTRRVTVKLEDSSHLSFRNVNSGVRITPYLIIPWQLRRGIKIENDRGVNLDGCLKIYPATPVEGEPRYM